jgi:hypothetical protein
MLLCAPFSVLLHKPVISVSAPSNPVKAVDNGSAQDPSLHLGYCLGRDGRQGVFIM